VWGGEGGVALVLCVFCCLGGGGQLEGEGGGGGGGGVALRGQSEQVRGVQVVLICNHTGDSS